MIDELRARLDSIFGLTDGTFEQVPYEEITTTRGPCFATNAEDELIGLSTKHILLNKIPEEIAEFSALETLYSFGCELKWTSGELANLSSLKALYLGGNPEFPLESALNGVTNLEVLGLNRNRIERIPDALSQMTKLRILGLGFNRISRLSEELGSLKKLERLYLGDNHVRELPHQMASFHPDLKILELSENPIKSNVEKLMECRSLTKLGLRNTGIKQLPRDMGGLQDLEALDIGQNDFENVPDELSKLDKLQSLSFNGSRLINFPKAVLSMENLRRLEFSNSPLQNLPDQIERLKELETLLLIQCQLRTVPDTLFRMPKLEYVDLRRNRISVIPPEAIYLKAPISLSTPSANKLHVLESLEGVSERVPGVYVKHNPISSPPFEVINAGEEAVKSYLQSIVGETRPVNEVKVLLVGEGASGKTSLVRRLLDEEFDPSEPQTHGIRIRKFRFDQKARHFIGHIWDFGGQELMHATHQFFLSRRSIYLLVVDGRREEKIEYWLKHVEAFGGNSPVFVVLNKLDENPSFDVNKRFLREKYPNIKGFFRVSCKNGEGVKDLASNLKALFETVESSQTVWPLSWFDVKEKLEATNEDYISFADFRTACSSSNVKHAKHQNTLLRFLNDLGIVLNFGDLALRDTNVINPVWVTDGVYRIVNAKSVSDNDGIVKLADLQHLLDCSFHPLEKHTFLVELMKKFELCYAISDDAFLLPALLPVEEPALPAVGQDPIRFRFQYEFLPKSIMPRIIVRLHDEISEGLTWRSGVILQNDGLSSRAILRADDEEARIDITVWGEQKKEYLGVIVNTIRMINRSFEGVVFDERIVLSTRQKLSVSYAHLLRMKAQEFEEFIPEGASSPRSIDKLLGGVQSQRVASQQEILALLRSLHEANDTTGSLAKKTEQAVILQPNFFGIGVDLKKIARGFLNSEKKK